MGDDCQQSICKTKTVKDYCGPSSCHIDHNKKFICNCNEDLYNLNEYGMCDFKDTCNKKASCSKQAACFNQKVKKDRDLLDSYMIKSYCGCKRGLFGANDKNECVDPRNDKTKCEHLPFTRSGYLHEVDEQVSLNFKKKFT